MNIWWIRRDLHLHDNPALTSALSNGNAVLPVFIMDPGLLARPAEKRQAFLFAGLRELDIELKKLGSKLIVRSGDPAHELKKLASEVEADRVYAEEDYSPYAMRRDAAVGREVNLQLVHGLSVHHPAVVTKVDGSPYTVFTPFSRAWCALPFDDNPLPAPTRMPPTPAVDSTPLPELDPPAAFPAGEAEAKRRLDVFLGGAVRGYAQDRGRVDMDGTSSLSPYLRFGMLSARTAAAAAYDATRESDDPLVKQSCATWVNQLIWREFYQSILYHFPGVLDGAFKPALRGIPWRDAPQDLAAWQAGRTGYPVVDAAMRQLATTGWMHNRARMISASFLVKDLLINWQEGERWFMRHLVDGDPAANNGGWQWTAGTGTDAAPYFRVFNLVLQGMKFDPRGDYVRLWLPELKNVPSAKIHSPWLMTAEEQRAAGVVIGRDYPTPIVEHAFARERALKAYKRG
ncbi:MAG: deoxyribodipyrimidine photo-lyase [Anaerolineaceae bacterium]